MKSFSKNCYKQSGNSFADVSWVRNHPTGSKKNLDEMYAEVEMRREKNQKKYKAQMDDNLSSVDMEPKAAIQLAIDKFPQKQTDFKGNVSSKSYRSSTAPSEIIRSSMQIVEDHLLERVFVRRLYGGIYLYNGRYYTPLTEQDWAILVRRESDDGIVSMLKSYRQFSDAYRFLSSNPDIEFKDYNKDSVKYKTFTVFNNVLVDVRTKEIYKHQPSYPVFFGVDAFYKKHPKATPNWDHFVDTVSQGDNKVKKLIHEMLGYLLLQGNDGKCFFVLAPAPNSGKSLFGDFIESLFPDEYVAHIAIDNFSDRFALGSLWKTVVNVSMDLPQSTLSADTVSLVKTITGDSKITTEEKYMPIGTALNRCKLVFGTNSQLSVSIPDKAFWDRVVIFPFVYEIPRRERQTDLLAKLIDEKDDILSKCIPYVKKLIDRNYEFTIPEISASMKNAWSGNTGDAIGKFFSRHCEISDDSEGISVAKLYELFLDFCSVNGLFPGIEDHRNFSIQMRKRYPEIVQKKRRIPEAENPVSVFANVNYCSDER